MKRQFIYGLVLGLLVGGAIAQSVHATPTRAESFILFND
jgi:hypothetical protein